MCLPWRAIGRWGLAIGLVWAVMLWGWMPAALASLRCQQIEGQQVCVETIKRSAKYLWEYRVVLSLNGERQPLKRYDCRQVTTAQPEPATPSALQDDIRQFICGLVPHSGR